MKTFVYSDLSELHVLDRALSGNVDTGKRPIHWPCPMPSFLGHSVTPCDMPALTPIEETMQKTYVPSGRGRRAMVKYILGRKVTRLPTRKASGTSPAKLAQHTGDGMTAEEAAQLGTVQGMGVHHGEASLKDIDGGEDASTL